MQKEGLNAPTEDESIVEETSYKCLEYLFQIVTRWFRYLAGVFSSIPKPSR